MQGLTVNFTGDFCVSEVCESIICENKLDSKLLETDYNFCCFEAPVIIPNAKIFVKSGPNLNQKRGIDSIISKFSHVSIANNHIMDYGIEGCLNTIGFLNSYNIDAIGAGQKYDEIYQPAVIEKNGISVAVFCWGEAQFGCWKSKADKKGGYAWMLNPQNINLIQAYKKKVDYVVLYVHAGLEMVDIPLFEWREIYKSFIDLGADFIVGTHPHIIQGKENYKGKTIYYSLGNFFFNNSEVKDYRWNESLMLHCHFNQKSIEIEEIFLKRSQNRICLADNKTSLRFLELSRILLEENYDNYFSIYIEECLNAWEDYMKYYFSFPISKERTKNKFIHTLIKKYFGNYINHSFKPPIPFTYLYHNLNTETDRFVCSRVFSEKSSTY